MRRTRPHRLALLLLMALLTAGCGEVVLGFDSRSRADLRLDGPVTVTRHAGGDQTVSGTVVNAGDVEAFDVEVTLTLFVIDGAGVLVPWETVAPPVPVFDVVFGTRTLHPGERGVFAVLLPGRPPIEQVDVDIGARFLSSSGFVFFFFSPGLVIITG